MMLAQLHAAVRTPSLETMSLSTDLMPEYCALVCSLTFTVSSGYTQQMPLTPPTVPAITSCAKVPCCIVPPCTQAHKDLCKRSDSYCTKSVTFAPSSCMQQQVQRLEIATATCMRQEYVPVQLEINE
eukprot:4906-Heterococcus_DN1.PRE.1